MHTSPPQATQLLRQARQIEHDARWADGPAWAQDQHHAQRLREQARQLTRTTPSLARQAQKLEQTRQARAAEAAAIADIISTGTWACYAHNRRLGMSESAAARVFGQQAASLEARYQQEQANQPDTLIVICPQQEHAA